jgi:hypothetical protein
MERSEKALLLIKRAEEIGMRLQFDSGLCLVTVERSAPAGPEQEDSVISELMQYFPEVRRLLEIRAFTRRAQELIGKKICLWDGVGYRQGPAGYGSEVKVSIVRQGVLERVEGNKLAVTIVREDHEETVTALAEHLLILEEAEAGASSPQTDKPVEQQRKGFLNRFRGSQAD